MTRALVIVLFAAVSTAGTVVDRIAVVVEKHAIKDSDIEREIRVTNFLNKEPLSFAAADRRQAAQRLIDQAILRREIQLGQYDEASEADVSKLYTQASGGKASLASYGLTPDQLRRALRWQLTVLHFIELRFKPQQALGVKDPFESWLDDTRKAVNIQYREEDLK